MLDLETVVARLRGRVEGALVQKRDSLEAEQEEKDTIKKRVQIRGYKDLLRELDEIIQEIRKDSEAD